MRVRVTGGAGYVGSVVKRQFMRAGHEVVVFDNLSNGHRESIPPGVPLIVADVGDTSALNGAFEQYSPNAVMHFAAYIEAGESFAVGEVSR